MTALADKIRTRGHWTARLHPEAYASDRIQRLVDLENVVRSSAVSLRGWDFPHYNLRVEPSRSSDYVEQVLDWEHYLEIWRAYKSGQFVSICGLWDDWRDQSKLWPAPEGWRSGATLWVEDTVFRLIEIFEFAARWSRSLSVEGPLVVECTLRGLENRSLQLGPRRSGFSYPRICKVPAWSHSASYQSTALLAQPRELAVPPAISLFELFGWDVTPEIVRDIQGELRG